jgi:hypothetical protein
MIVCHVLLWVVGCVSFVAVLEYIGHRYFMHRPLMDRFGLPNIFFNHAVLHHRGRRNDRNVDLPVRTHFLWGFPFVGAIGYFDLTGAVVLSLCFVGHAVLWTRIHRAIHGLENNWTKRLWFYRAIERHHLEHHRRPGRNFGAVFFFTDHLFGTYSRPEHTRTAETPDHEPVPPASQEATVPEGPNEPLSQAGAAVRSVEPGRPDGGPGC